MFYLISIFANLWVYRIAGENMFVGLLVITTTIVLVKYLTSKSKSKLLLIVSFIALMVFQLIHLQTKNFNELTNDEIRVRDERLSAYPPKYLKLGYYLEQRKEIVVTRKVINSVVNELDLNLYFFAGHPREKIGVKEFEKFPYILLPVFVLGLVKILKLKKYYIFLFLIPLLIVVLNKNNFVSYNFSLFPFFSSTIYMGLVYSNELLRKIKFKNLIYPLFLILLLLNLIQIISYQLA